MLWTRNMFFVCVLVCSFVSIVYTQDNLLVNITQGIVQGTPATDGEYLAFFGIPYAGNVGGENRFKSPPPPPSFPGVFMANNPNVVCAQPTRNGIVGEENCLTLNVLTKNSTGARPVMVWIMGDHYTTATNQGLTFRRFIEIEDLVVVTLNYRLSIFGFLCLGVEDAPGNAGLKDVVAGLRWVRNNIAAFGGDPNNVLLAGHGSGAAMVDLVTLSPLASGLVHKAIAQSGTSLSPWAVAYTPLETARAVGLRIGFRNMNNAELARAFRDTNLSVLITALNEFEFRNNTALFAPCIENPNLQTNDSFMTTAPINTIRAGNYSHIPYITGYTNREGSRRAHQAVHDGWLDAMDRNFEEFIQADLNFDNESNRTGIINSIRNFYFSERRVNLETIEDYLDYHGDTLVLVSAIRTAFERARTSSASVRLYEFGYIGTWSAEWPYPTIPLTGARHGQELAYLFEAGSVNTNMIDETVRSSLVRRWAAFARTGEPVAIVEPGSVEWPPVTTNALRALEYTEAIQSSAGENAKINPHELRMAFWNNLYDRFYVQPQGSSAHKILSHAFIIFFSVLFINLF